MNFKKIAVFGLGLLGGSICRDLKKISGGIEITAFGRNPGRLKEALVNGCIDAIGDIDKPDIKGADLIIVSLPVLTSVGFIGNILNNPDLNENAIVIDVGSVKESIINEIEKSKKADRFIGCHPMAGSEKTGYVNSREELFKDASVIITPNKFNKIRDIDIVKNFWETLKAKTIIVPAGIHDLLISYTSHVPHITACLIVELLNEIILDSSISGYVDKSKANYFIGSGFRDFTRIASGSARIWSEILLQNSHNISNSIEKLIEKLQTLKGILNSDIINAEDLNSFFERIRSYKILLDA